jgi:glycosyltransferase involved in cell wall biosynthesis
MAVFGNSLKFCSISAEGSEEMNSKVSGNPGAAEESIHTRLGVAALIPALNPDENLIALAHELREVGFSPIILVDDGSNDSSSDIFDVLSSMPDVDVLRHFARLGRGSALKTGFNHFLLKYPECAGIVTIDTNGRHSPEDALAVAKMLLQDPKKLVLGCRAHDTSSSWASRLGNILAASLLRLFAGKRISDTKTPLRGISRFAIQQMMALDSNRYEFELEMLINSSRFADDVVEQRIQAI